MDNFSKLIQDYKTAFPRGEVRENEPMSAHTTLKIGGRVRGLALPKTQEEAAWLVTEAKERGVRSLVIGNGSNMLFSDDALDILIIKTTKLCAIETSGETIFAGAGASLYRIAVEAQSASLTGFEFAHGIPGTLGGAVYMNAGAYGGEMKDVVESVTVLTENGHIKTLAADDCAFGYRRSVFCENGDIILSAAIRLSRGDKGAISAKMAELAAKRREKQPLNLPSAGSTFKRPKDGFAAAMIDEAGLKGFQIGGAQVSEKHAGFVVNTGGATFDDFMGVVEHVRHTVFDRTGVMLEPEVRIIRS